DPAEGRVAQDLPNDVAVVINLAGESIIGRWTTEKRRRIIESRTRPIEVLSAFMKDRGIEPDLWINASGVGYYGPRGESVFGEESPLGRGFLAEVCRDWEAAAMANDVAKRTIAGRFGVVMSAAGGALKQMLPAFNVGAGGPLGNKAAYMPWITLLDLVYALEHCMQHPEISGPVNFTAPGAVTQAGFARALGKAVKRPAFLPTPAAPLKLVFGDMATETLLIDQQVEPSVLKQTGFRWSFPEIEDALKFELGRL
ncbi:MAG: TIGR01777 family oxidoreductase, partial [Opitutales bacterium]|nr:TIGR01777 family oxidoreductase [Opitutales bacterium]